MRAGFSPRRHPSPGGCPGGRGTCRAGPLGVTEMGGWGAASGTGHAGGSGGHAVAFASPASARGPRRPQAPRPCRRPARTPRHVSPRDGGAAPPVCCVVRAVTESQSLLRPVGNAPSVWTGRGRPHVCVCVGGRGLSPGGVIVTVGHLGAGRGDMEGRPGQREKARLPT